MPGGLDARRTRFAVEGTMDDFRGDDRTSPFNTLAAAAVADGPVDGLGALFATFPVDEDMIECDLT